VKDFILENMQFSVDFHDVIYGTGLKKIEKRLFVISVTLILLEQMVLMEVNILMQNN
jgi:hypothetical protein